MYNRKEHFLQPHGPKSDGSQESKCSILGHSVYTALYWLHASEDVELFPIKKKIGIHEKDQHKKKYSYCSILCMFYYGPKNQNKLHIWSVFWLNYNKYPQFIEPFSHFLIIGFSCTWFLEENSIQNKTPQNSVVFSMLGSKWAPFRAFFMSPGLGFSLLFGQDGFFMS